MSSLRRGHANLLSALERGLRLARCHPCAGAMLIFSRPPRGPETRALGALGALHPSARSARPSGGSEARASSSLSGGMLIFSALEGGVGNACFHPYAGAMLIFSRPSRGA